MDVAPDLPDGRCHGDAARAVHGSPLQNGKLRPPRGRCVLTRSYILSPYASPAPFPAGRALASRLQVQPGASRHAATSSELQLRLRRRPRPSPRSAHDRPEVTAPRTTVYADSLSKPKYTLECGRGTARGSASDTDDDCRFVGNSGSDHRHGLCTDATIA